jgi:squalene cyclase
MWAAEEPPPPAALRLLRTARSGESGKSLHKEINAFLKRQNADGGWSPTKDLPSDAYATGQALYFLSLAGVKKDRAAIQRGVAFLVGRQQPDGSWPMTPRAHPGARPMKDPIPIIYFGTAWATMGLMRVAPK